MLPDSKKMGIAEDIEKIKTKIQDGKVGGKVLSMLDSVAKKYQPKPRKPRAASPHNLFVQSAMNRLKVEEPALTSQERMKRANELWAEHKAELATAAAAPESA